MSAKQDIYKSYVENFHQKHPRVKDIAPTLIHLQYQDGENFFHEQKAIGMTLLSRSTSRGDYRYWSYLLSDNRVLECNLAWACTESDRIEKIRTNSNMVLFYGRIFQNKQDWMDYDQPMSFHTYFEG